jgi:FkbM family methyltransferase
MAVSRMDQLSTVRRQIEEFAATLQWRLAKPEYLFRPSTILRRLTRYRGREGRGAALVHLYWGLSLRVRTDDTISSGILHTGIDDITQSEIIWRLLRPGDAAVDIGANIGYVTSIMAAKVGAKGRVLAFEPHPDLCDELRKNVSDWGLPNPQVEVFDAALSERPGEGSLSVPSGFQKNRGLSRVQTSRPGRGSEISFPIGLRRLDDIWKGEHPIALVKIDVEGHELPVLKGAQRLLERRLIRNVVFEDFEGRGSESMRLLNEAGYTIWQLRSGLLGPRLAPPGACKQAPWLPPNFLASLTPGAVEESLRPRGWRILRPATAYPREACLL